MNKKPSKPVQTDAFDTPSVKWTVVGTVSKKQVADVVNRSDAVKRG